MFKKASHSISPFLLLTVFFLVSSNVLATSNAFVPYKDSLGRFSLDFPGTMQVQAKNPDDVLIFHPNATFRINILIEKRPKKVQPDATAFMNAFKENLKQEAKQSEILKEGRSTSIDGAQAYLIYTFTDKRGIRMMQLCQFYATEDLFLQLIINDRAEGFKNLEQVISRIHESFRILKPDLK